MTTTDEYLLNAFQSRSKTIAKAFKRQAKGKQIEGQDADEFLSNFPLCLDVKIHVSIVISTGGPHEEIDCVVSKAASGYGYELDSATFGAYWGGEKRETTLHEDDALWRYAEYMLEGWELPNA